MHDSVRHLYVHIPFCPTKCNYCAFETHIGSLRLVPDYVEALGRELELTAGDGSAGPLETVYFGGGTPSMLTPAQLRTIMARIESLIGVKPCAEVTLEAYPGTTDERRLGEYRGLGVTRISFGVESFDPVVLGAIGRTHSPEQARQAIRSARMAGIDHIALDLIYGLPGQSEASWKGTLDTALSQDVDHLSLYPLAVEPRTVFARTQREGGLLLPPDEVVVEMYEAACRLLEGAGFEHYEVANWARPGHRCRHNLAYWYNREFFGVGVGAHAYVAPYRTENVRGTRRYIQAILTGNSPIASRERISPDIALAETAMLRLRLLSDGLDMKEISKSFGVDFAGQHRDVISELGDLGLIEVKGRVLRLPESAVPVANEVWERFIRLPPRTLTP
jgi:oxygen-independent coproporphyrinogen-3 oxidase